jgi:hypothetical protein
MTADLAHRKPSRIYRHDLVIELREAPLIFGDQLRIEAASPVACNRQRHLGRAGQHRLLRRAIAIRAEDLVQVPPGEPADFAGPVQRLIDLGAFRMVQVDLGAEEPFKVRLQKGGGLQEGDALALRTIAATIFRPGQPPIQLQGALSDQAAPEPKR